MELPDTIIRGMSTRALKQIVMEMQQRGQKLAHATAAISATLEILREGLTVIELQERREGISDELEAVEQSIKIVVAELENRSNGEEKEKKPRRGRKPGRKPGRKASRLEITPTASESEEEV